MKKKFSKEERELLQKNKNVKTVISTAIIYQDFFKKEAIICTIKDIQQLIYLKMQVLI